MKNIGLVGLGFIGRTHLEAYQFLTNCQVTMICTRKKVTDQELTTTYNASFVTDYEALLSNSELDIIDICLPTYLHEEFIIKAVKAGKHIICEKPLALSVESAKRMIEMANQYGVKLFVGHLLRFWPEYMKIKSYSEGDKLTNIETAYAKRLGQEPDWSTWFQYPKKSGGALFDLHIHDIDYMYYLLGEVEAVYAVGHKNQLGAWDHIMTTLTFTNGCQAFVEASHRMPKGFPFTMSFRAQTSTSTIDFHIASDGNIENMDSSNNQFIYYKNEHKSFIEVNESDAFQYELAYFVNCLENDQENNIIPLDEVVYTLQLLEAIEHSLETRREVRVADFLKS